MRLELLRHGLTVLEPVGTQHAFDMAVLLEHGRILRVQCKTSRRLGDCLLFNSCSTDHGSGRLDYGGRADVFGVGDLDARDVYMVDVSEAATRVTSLRLTPTKNGQQLRIRLARDHELATWLERQPNIVRG